MIQLSKSTKRSLCSNVQRLTTNKSSLRKMIDLNKSKKKRNNYLKISKRKGKHSELRSRMWTLKWNRWILDK